MAKNESPPDPTRSDERDALDAAKDDGFKDTVKTGYEVVRYTGERVYFSDNEADAKDRLKERSACTLGIGGSDGAGEPAYTLRTVQYVEVDGFDPKGPESRTRGKRDGSEPDPDDQGNV